MNYIQKFKKVFLSFFLICLLVLSGCSADKSMTGPSGEDIPSVDGPSEGGIGQIQPGQITAAAYSDVKNFDFWLKLRSKTINQDNQEQSADEYGIFYEYAKKCSTEFITSNLVEVQLTDVNNEKIYNATVELQYDGEVLFRAKSDKEGRAILYYPNLNVDTKTIKVEVSYLNINLETINVSKEIGKSIKTIVVFERLEAPVANLDAIELMFVVDTTGSMSDELEYLKVEIADVIAKVENQNPNVAISLALIFYRDYGDSYVTKCYDFTTDIAKQTQMIDNQSANGGGDFEEAVEVAMDKAVNAQWMSGNSTKIIVHVADAPSHEKDYAKWNQSVLTAAEKGIKIITVASSGIDTLTEFLFRSQSMMTNSHYVFITNDSGIGNDHLEPTIAEKVTVEYLNALLVRLINGYYTGEMQAPIHYSQMQ